MQEPQGHIEPPESSAAYRVSRILKRPNTWSTTVKTDPHTEFDSVLLAIAGNDLRQPLQVIRNAHECLSRGVRTTSEPYLHGIVQSAVDRLSGQLDELVAALRLKGQAQGVGLRPVQVGPLLQRTAQENEAAALAKGVRIRTVPTNATIESDALLLAAVLRNPVGNAVKYTKPGGSVLLGCRQTGRSARIDVYDTGIGICEHQMARIFEAFTRLDPRCGDGLGIGLFIVRQAVGILGHRIDVASTPNRGSRFSIFASGAGETGTGSSTSETNPPVAGKVGFRSARHVGE
jgi:two-component system, OmpR family, phosphate regulon sensor histidine kinase PhoR